jgi:hypothetical protein
MLAMPLKADKNHPWHSYTLGNHPPTPLFGEDAEILQKEEEFANFRKRFPELPDSSFVLRMIKTASEFTSFFTETTFNKGDKVVVTCHGRRDSGITCFDGSIIPYTDWSVFIDPLLEHGTADVAMIGCQINGLIASPLLGDNKGKFLHVPDEPGKTQFLSDVGADGKRVNTAVHQQLKLLNFNTFQLCYSFW